MKRAIQNKNAVSTTVSTVLVVSIVISSVAIIMGWGLPYIEEQKINSQKQTAENGLLSLSDSVNDLIAEGFQTSGVADISNENDRGSITLDPNSDKFVLWYAFNESYNFTVDGLEDEDSSFNITEINKPSVDGDLDRIDVYKIDAGLTLDTGSDAASGGSYKKLYDNDTDGDADCSQRFLAPGSWDPKGIRVFVASYGDISSDIDVILYSETDGEDGSLDERMAEGTISQKDVYTYRQVNENPSLGWRSCDFEGTIKTLTAGNYYHLFLSTDGGNESNFYYWYLNGNIYGNTDGENGNSTDEYALTGTYPDGLDTWIKLKGNDFSRRIIYSDNYPPDTPVVQVFGENISSDQEFFSGVEYDLSICSDDPDNDEISYIVYWGDGNNTGWTDDFPSGTTESHIWSEAGSYTIIVNAKDSYGNICNSSKTCTITVKPFETIPTDSYDVFPDLIQGKGFSRPGINNVYVDISGLYPDKTLDGDLFINLIDSNNIIYPDPDDPKNESHNGTDGKVPFGRIWVFDIGALTVTAPYESETLKTIYQNGAIISVSSDGVEFIKEPSIFEKNNANQTTNANETDALSMRFVQINGSVSAGGSSITATLNYKITNSLSREPYFVNKFYNLKMQIFGENEDLWYDYFDKNSGFELSTDAQGNKILIYNQEVDSCHSGIEDFSLIFDDTFIDFGLVRIQ